MLGVRNEVKVLNVDVRVNVCVGVEGVGVEGVGGCGM